MSYTFTKLFTSITESTVWGEPAGTRLVWITMLAKADREGRVFASVPGLANLARVSLNEAVIAIETLSGPDKWSRTPDAEGRRIEAIDGGWRLINHAKYREMGQHEVASMKTEGYVYYVGEEGGCEVKIGFSKNPWARIADLRVTNPRLHILATEKGTLQTEKDRHGEFQDSRTKGEWFGLSDRLKAYIEAINASAKNTTTTTVATVATSATTKDAEADTEAEAVNQKQERVQPSADTPRKRGRPHRVPLPAGFAISERVERWAKTKGHDRLDQHLEAFIDKASKLGLIYADWDAALMEAIRENWAKLPPSPKPVVVAPKKLETQAEANAIHERYLRSLEPDSRP